MAQGHQPTVEEIQGRLNQREIPWLVSEDSPGDSPVTFRPKDGAGISVVWDRAHPGFLSLGDVIDVLASYRGAGT
jgi:hypothetical protein